MMRRVLSVWLPRLATDRLCRAQPAWRAEPLATVSAQQGGLRVVAVTPAAEALGIALGLTLADARALFPGLKVATAAPAEEAKLVAALADWCGRYSPWTAAEGAEGIWIEITGAAHLFGGEDALLADLRRRLGKLGFASRAAIADTPGAAWAAARFHADEEVIVPPGGAARALVALPAVALRLAPLLPEALARVGLDTIGALLAVPRAPLAARFGDGVLTRIEQFLGTLGEPISPRHPVPEWRARLAFAEPIGRLDDILAACERLLKRLCIRLARDQRGARRLDLVVYLIDGQTRRAAIGTSRPVRDPQHLHRLFREPLRALEVGFGVEAMVLAARETEPLAAETLVLPGARQESADLTAAIGLLLDRLGNRLGEANVQRFVARESYIPERAVHTVPAVAKLPAAAWRVRSGRPIRLLPNPEPVEAVAPVPDDPPVLFRWRRQAHRVVRAEGPERLAPEWWRGEGSEGSGALTRDYYRIEDVCGRRFWLYREGLYRAGASPRWFLHGVFG